MRSYVAMLLPLFLGGMSLAAVACDADGRGAAKLKPGSASSGAQATRETKEDKMKIIIGSKTFEATLEDNPTAKELQARLPLRLDMAELNGNEKHTDLSNVLPADARRPGTIRTGDLLLYGDRTLVLFYKTFESSYSYTRLGRIDDPSGLAAAVGKGNVRVTFELE